MLGFKSINSARAILGGIEMVHMMRKGQAKYAAIRNLHSLNSSSSLLHNPKRASSPSSRLRFKFATEPHALSAWLIKSAGDVIPDPMANLF